MVIMGIETSCDETAGAIVKNGKYVLSNVVSSSLRLHRDYGGVIPEIAARHHVENIDKVIQQSLQNAGMAMKDIDAVAVTQGPGLAGALLTGISCAKAIAYSLDIPLIAVNHVKAHIYSALMRKDPPKFPFIGLVISGGHTRLYLVQDFDNFMAIGDTLDDAIGEAYDKVAKILKLGYPGGPIIDKLAKKGDPKAIRFICRGIKGSLDFSFSGVKTGVLYYCRAQENNIASYRKGAGQARKQVANIAAGFQDAVLKVILDNSLKAMEKYHIKTIVIGGGVSANTRLREMIAREEKFKNFKAYFPVFELCSDNAVMIAGLAYRLYKKGVVSDLNITVSVTHGNIGEKYADG